MTVTIPSLTTLLEKWQGSGPSGEGTNVSGQKDANGKLFHDAIIRTARNERIGLGGLHVSEAGANTAVAEWAVVKALKILGVPGLVASGFYPD